MSELEDLKDPEEEETPESEGETDAEAEEQEEAATSEETTPESKKPAQPETVPLSRFNEVYGKAKQAEREVEYWRNKAMEEQKPAEEKPKDKAENKPRYEDFDDEDQYQEALVDWKLEQRDKERQAQAKEKAAQEKQASFQQKLKEGANKFQDFWDVAYVPDSAPATEAILDVLSDSELAADLVYYLGSNRDEAQKIANMTPSAAARELGKLEVKIADKQTTPKKTTEQPTPTKPTKGGEGPPTKKEDEMTMEEWEAWYDKKYQEA